MKAASSLGGEFNLNVLYYFRVSGGIDDYFLGRKGAGWCQVLMSFFALFNSANDSSEKFARNILEYRSCQFTDSDEQFRMVCMCETFVFAIWNTPIPGIISYCQHTALSFLLGKFRMQFICLLVGIWSLRNVRRQRVVSASLFDQRRMRIQGSRDSSGVHGSSSSTSNGKNSSRLRKNSVELTQQQNQQKHTGYTKVPKSPAPDINGNNSNNMQTVWSSIKFFIQRNLFRVKYCQYYCLNSIISLLNRSNY